MNEAIKGLVGNSDIKFVVYWEWEEIRWFYLLFQTPFTKNQKHWAKLCNQKIKKKIKLNPKPKAISTQKTRYINSRLLFLLSPLPLFEKHRDFLLTFPSLAFPSLSSPNKPKSYLNFSDEEQVQINRCWRTYLYWYLGRFQNMLVY